MKYLNLQLKNRLNDIMPDTFRYILERPNSDASNDSYNLPGIGIWVIIPKMQFGRRISTVNL